RDRHTLLSALFSHSVHKGRVIDHFHPPIQMLKDCGHRLHPIPRVQVVDFIKIFISGCMDMSANDALTMALASKLTELLLITSDITHSRFHFRFNGFAERKGLLSSPRPIPVIPPIRPEEEPVTKGPEHCHPPMVRGYLIKAVTVDDQI